MIEIKNATKIRIPTASLKTLARKVLLKEKVKQHDVSVVFLGEKEARTLNKMYRGKTYVPNILSFSFDSAQDLWPMEELGLGELVLCPVQIRKDAAKYGITFTAELYRIFIHGLLHLAGYDHAKDADFKKMSQKEKEYLLLVS